MKIRNLCRKANRKYASIAALAVCLVLIAALIGAAIGRYQRQFDSEGYVKAQEFYFTSDFLDGNTHTLAPGSTSVSFTLGNHADELRYSEVDIEYEVTVNTAAGVTNNATVEYSNAQKKLANGGVQDHTVTIKGMESGKTYTVTATGKGGYEKTLTATIEVLSTEPAVYKHLDTTNPDYVLLTVWAQNYQGSVTVTPLSTGMIPDNTDPVMKDVQTGAEFTDSTSFKDNGCSSHVYRFFGSGVTAADFTVTYGGSKTAVVKAPG